MLCEESADLLGLLECRLDANRFTRIAHGHHPGRGLGALPARANLAHAEAFSDSRARNRLLRSPLGKGIRGLRIAKGVRTTDHAVGKAKLGQIFAASVPACKAPHPGRCPIDFAVGNTDPQVPVALQVLRRPLLEFVP